MASSKPGALAQLSDELADLVQTIERCTVTLEGEDQNFESSGSGFVIDEHGHIVTNDHVLHDYTSMTATVGVESRQKATIVGRDSVTDLAVLVLGTPTAEHLTLRDAPPRVGELCIAVGSPFGVYQESVSFGVISGLGRDIPRENMRPLEDTIQTDAAINPGNSGGPLVDMRGEVIGVNAMSDSRGQNLNFAVSADTVRFVIGELLTEGRVRRAALGLGVVNEPYVDGDDKPALRLRITRVDDQPTGPFQKGDVIVELAGTAIRERSDLYKLLTKDRIGVAIPAVVMRNDQRVELQCTPRELPEAGPAKG